VRLGELGAVLRGKPRSQAREGKCPQRRSPSTQGAGRKTYEGTIAALPGLVGQRVAAAVKSWFSLPAFRWLRRIGPDIGWVRPLRG
jgi:hypothetical protein